jgi:hypothetical protein
MNAPRRRYSIERLFSALLLIVMGITVAVGLAEWGSRIFLGEYRSVFEQRFPIERTRTPAPYIMFKGVPSEEISPSDNPYGEHFNRLGYRGPAPDDPKPAGEYRIFILGGSTVYVGSKAFDGFESIPEHLQSLFHTAGHDNVKIYNFGVPSSVSGQELARLVYELIDHAPDLIVMYNGGNDLLAPLSYDPRPGYPFNFAVHEANPLLIRDLGNYPLMNLMVLGTNLGRWLLRSYIENSLLRMSDLKEKSGWGSENWIRAIAKSYVSNITKAASFVATYKVDFISYFQPMLYFKRPLSRKEAAYLEKTDTNGAASGMARAFRKGVLIEAKRAQTEKGLMFSDLGEMFSEEKRKTVFVDEIHTSYEGIRASAAAIFTDLQAREIGPFVRP